MFPESMRTDLWKWERRNSNHMLSLSPKDAIVMEAGEWEPLSLMTTARVDGVKNQSACHLSAFHFVLHVTRKEVSIFKDTEVHRTQHWSMRA